MKVLIRQEKRSDYNTVFKLIKNAFELIDISDHKEQFLAERLRKLNTFIPELSLVAASKNEIVGIFY